MAGTRAANMPSTSIVNDDHEEIHTDEGRPRPGDKSDRFCLIRRTMEIIEVKIIIQKARKKIKSRPRWK